MESKDISSLKPHSVDKTCLAKALKFENQESLSDCAWVQHLPPDEFISNSIYLEGKSQIKIPVSLTDFETLKVLSEESFSGKRLNISHEPVNNHFKGIIPSQSRISLAFQADDILGSIIERHLDLPPEFTKRIVVHPEKLLLFEPGRRFARNIQPSHSGERKLATVAVQVPVKGGYDGGNINVKYKEEHQIFDLHHNSQKGFHMAFIGDCCEQWMEPITRGANLMFVYNVTWSHPEIEDLPSFLTALKEVKKSMECWNTSIHTNSVPTQPEKEDVLYFTLDGYYGSDLSFDKLHGNDRKMAFIFLNCPFLDVMLAQVYHRVEKIEDVGPLDLNEDVAKGKRLKRPPKIIERTDIVRWIDSKDKSIDFTLELDWKSHYSGCGRYLLDVDQVQPVSQNNDWDFDAGLMVNGKSFCHSILIVWPRSQSQQMNCRYGLGELLDRIEIYYPILTPEERHEVYLKLAQYLQVIITTWSDPIPRLKNHPNRVRLLIRLLRFCTWLRARREGIQVLKILGEAASQLSLPSLNAHIEDIGRVIAEFQSQITGWEDCADVIKQMINPEQIGIVSKLAKCFRLVNCTEGAKMLGDYVSSYMSQMTSDRVKDMKNHLIFIFSLEEELSTSNEERLASFATLFFRMDPSVQCQLVLDLEDIMKSHRWGKLPQLNVLMDNLCESLTYCDIYAEPVPTETVIQLILVFIRLGNENLLKDFLRLITGPFYMDTSSPDFVTLEERKNDSIQQMTTSPLIQRLAISSNLGQLVLKHLIGCRFSNCEDESQSLSSYLKLIIELELTTSPPDPNRVAVVKLLSGNLNAIQLAHVLSDVISLHRDRLKTCLEDVPIIQNLFQVIMSQLRDEGNSHTFQSIMIETPMFMEHFNIGETLVKTMMTNLIEMARDHKKFDGISYDNLIEKIHQCVDIFFCTEKNLISSSKHKSAASPFYDLFVQLPLDVMMKAILQIYSKEFEKSDDIKKWPTCFDWLKNVLKFGLKKDFVSEFIAKNTSYAVNIVLCLLWIEDPDAWRCFATSVCHSQRFNILVEPFGIDLPTNHKDLMGRIAITHPAMEAFANISVHAEILSSQMEIPPFSWHQPTARLPEYPEIEKFLRSNENSFTYANFKMISEARDFTRLLESSQLKNKFMVTVETSGSGKRTRCLIKKDRSFHEIHFRQPFLDLLGELPVLISLKSKLEDLCKVRSDVTLIEVDVSTSSSDASLINFDETGISPSVERASF